MLKPPIPIAEVSKRGNEWYEKLRPAVETAQNIGKRIVINVQTGAYEIDTDALAASHRLLDKDANAALYEIRIGYDAAYSLGGFLRPTTRP